MPLPSASVALLLLTPFAAEASRTATTTVVVTAATGKVGYPLWKELRKQPDVRAVALIRDESKLRAMVSKESDGTNVDESSFVVVKDYCDRSAVESSLAALAEGKSFRMYLACGNGPTQQEAELALLSAAAATGQCDFICKLSTLTAALEMKAGPYAAHLAVEDALASGSIAHAILRPNMVWHHCALALPHQRPAGSVFSCHRLRIATPVGPTLALRIPSWQFMQMLATPFVGIGDQLRVSGGEAEGEGEGEGRDGTTPPMTVFHPYADAGISMIDAEDVAQVAAALLLRGAPSTSGALLGETLELTGPSAVSYADLGRELSQVSGRQIVVETRSYEEHTAAVPTARTFLEVLGRASEVSGEVERILGRPATPLADYVRRSAESFAM